MRFSPDRKLGTNLTVRATCRGRPARSWRDAYTYRPLGGVSGGLSGIGLGFTVWSHLGTRKAVRAVGGWDPGSTD